MIYYFLFPPFLLLVHRITPIQSIHRWVNLDATFRFYSRLICFVHANILMTCFRGTIMMMDVPRPGLFDLPFYEFLQIRGTLPILLRTLMASLTIYCGYSEAKPWFFWGDLQKWSCYYFCLGGRWTYCGRSLLFWCPEFINNPLLIAVKSWSSACVRGMIVKRNKVRLISKKK